MNPIRLLALKIRTEKDVVTVRQQSRHIAALLGFDMQDQTRIATAVSEIARNAFRYARGGNVEFAVDGGFRIRVSDAGPGIANLAAILQGRYKSTTGMGSGIAGARKLMDQFQIESTPGHGVVVAMQKDLPRRAVKLTPETLASIAETLSRDRGHDLYEEIDSQNRELLQLLEDIHQRHSEMAQLNRELEDTNRGVVALYAELDERAEHLRRADLLKSTFLSHMSHEFRTPLNSIVALSKILQSRLDGPLTDEQAKQVAFIRTAAQELTEMVNDLLDLAKVEAGKVDIHLSEFDVATLLGTLRGMMRPLNTNADVQLIFEDPGELPTMCTDEAKVSQILRNFISNALKFTEHGEVRVTCQHEMPSDVFIFTVSDSGLGIAPEEQEQIFQQYYQIDSPRQRKVKGTGLGLPLSRKLAELLGGSIQLRSEAGSGSQFSVRLPRHLDIRAEECDAGLFSAKDEPARTPRILVIDDEDVARYLVRKLLSSLAEIEEASGAAEGIEYARVHPVDVIILDLVMPGQNGFQALSILKDDPATRHIPVVIHTSISIGELERASLSGASAIVSKAKSEPELRDVVRSLVAGTGR